MLSDRFKHAKLRVGRLKKGRNSSSCSPYDKEGAGASQPENGAALAIGETGKQADPMLRKPHDRTRLKGLRERK